MQPIPIGAALMVADLHTYRDWLIAGQRDLEIQDFLLPGVLTGDWQDRVAQARALLDGFTGRLGIHGPFYDMTLDMSDADIAPIAARRFDTSVAAAAALGATQVVIHSPFTTWDWFNFPNNPRNGPAPSDFEAKIARTAALLAPAITRAEAEGVTLVIENIEDIDPGHRRLLAQALDTPAVRLSLDTGHAHYAHHATGAPPVDYFVTDAGALLAHVHLQDADGFADRHWPPGRGSVNWHAVFRALAALPHRPHLVLELRDPADIPAAMAWLEREGLAC
jgi:sugar phosphate isomerase/epimerase